ncbi:hypothetical protein GCM10027589_41780 [Actinocorallia lasiicapitis]
MRFQLPVAQRVLAASAVAVAATVVALAPSSAASAAVYCGSGYNVIASSKVKGSDGGVWGTVYLTYSKKTKKNCVTVIKSVYKGVSTRSRVTLWVKGGSPYSSAIDESVKYWGGPVALKAGKHCVKYQAILWSKNEINKAVGGRTGKWGNCG